MWRFEGYRGFFYPEMLRRRGLLIERLHDSDVLNNSNNRTAQIASTKLLVQQSQCHCCLPPTALVPYLSLHFALFESTIEI